MAQLNEMKLQFPAQTANISFARAAVAAFVSQLDPTLVDIEDISTAVSEAVTNAVVHGYSGNPNGIIFVSVRFLSNDIIEISVEDHGVGISNLSTAKEFGNTSQPEERIGIGFSLIEQCMDELTITTAEATSVENKMQVKPSWLVCFLRRGLGINRRNTTMNRKGGSGTRLLMRKCLHRPND